MQRLKELDARHKAAARMKIAGHTHDQIHSALNIAKRTLVVWFSDDLMKDYLQELAENIEQEFAQEMAGAGMVALQQLVGMVRKTEDTDTISVSQKVQVAREILDRLPGTAKNMDRAQMVAARNSGNDKGNGGDTNILNIGNLSNDDLADFVAGGWQKALGNGDSPDHQG